MRILGRLTDNMDVIPFLLACDAVCWLSAIVAEDARLYEDKDDLVHVQLLQETAQSVLFVVIVRLWWSDFEI